MHPEAFLYDLKCTPTGSAALPSEGICSSDTPYPQPKSKFPAQIASGMKPQEGDYRVTNQGNILINAI